MIPPRTGLCANCVEPRSTHLARTDKGRNVWLCDECDDVVGALRVFGDGADSSSNSFGNAIGPGNFWPSFRGSGR